MIPFGDERVCHDLRAVRASLEVRPAREDFVLRATVLANESAHVAPPMNGEVQPHRAFLEDEIDAAGSVAGIYECGKRRPDSQTGDVDIARPEIVEPRQPRSVADLEIRLGFNQSRF